MKEGGVIQGTAWNWTLNVSPDLPLGHMVAVIASWVSGANPGGGPDPAGRLPPDRGDTQVVSVVAPRLEEEKGPKGRSGVALEGYREKAMKKNKDIHTPVPMKGGLGFSLEGNMHFCF